MGFNDRIVHNGQATTLDMTGVVVDASSAAPTLLMNRVSRAAHISARVVATIATATTTYLIEWQVSDDNSTWADAVAANSPATVVFQTGTANRTAYVSAPPAVQAARFARVSCRIGVADGAAGDTCAIGYNYQLDDLV